METTFNFLQLKHFILESFIKNPEEINKTNVNRVSQHLSYACKVCSCNHVYHEVINHRRVN